MLDHSQLLEVLNDPEWVLDELMFKFEVVARCPHFDERDLHQVHVRIKQCDDATIEAHSISEYAKAFSDDKISVEALCATIALDFKAAVTVTGSVHDAEVDVWVRTVVQGVEIEAHTALS